MGQIHIIIRSVNAAPVVDSDQAVSFNSPTHNFTVEFLKERVEFAQLFSPKNVDICLKGRGRG